MRFAYRNYPDTRRGSDWRAALDVRLANPAKHSPPTRRFEAIIDSGASICIFHSSIGQAIGLDVEKGEEDHTTGVSGDATKIYLHNVSLYVPGDILTIRAGFTDRLPIAGLLGRNGFFEYYKITFDPSTEPPGFELERVGRA